ncbi:MAG: SprT family zinc-dependent metalloprotease [Planctomycetota bacterium]
MIAQAQHIDFGTTRLDYVVHSSPRRRTVAFRVSVVDGVEVVVPEDFDRARLPALVRQKAPWIIEKLGLVQDQAPAPEHEFVSGERFLYVGRRYRLQVRRTAPSTGSSLAFHKGRWLAQVPNGTPNLELPRVLRPLFVEWYRERAQERLGARVRHFARESGLCHAGVLVKDQERRWGSCTKDGVLGFNWRIIMARASAIDYVVVHELAHLVHRDHSPAFGAWSPRSSPTTKPAASGCAGTERS